MNNRFVDYCVVQTHSWAKLCFGSQHEALLTLRLNGCPQKILEKQEGVEGKKRLGAKNSLSIR